MQDEYIEVPLSKGKVALIDVEDADLILPHKWFVCGMVERYAARARLKVERPGTRQILMHRVILGAGPDELVDHINSDTFDNRKANLRIATKAENTRHARGLPRNNTSGYMGVELVGKRWRATLGKEGRLFRWGSFDSPEEAARERDKMAKEMHGEFAYLNFPD